MATKKLFREDPYAIACNAKITSLQDNEIMLDQTVFFAFAGGQASDHGTIAGITVTDARLSEDESDIIYTLEHTNGLEVGQEVEVQVDEARRTKLRRLHSAVHLVYLLFAHKHGDKECIGSNVSIDKGRYDMLMNESVAQYLPELQTEVNAFIDKDLEVLRKPNDENPDRWEWQLLDENGDKIPYMLCPCGGTHAARTGEIGHIKLKRKNIGGGKERIEVKLLSE